MLVRTLCSAYDCVAIIYHDDMLEFQRERERGREREREKITKIAVLSFQRWQS